MIPAERRQKMLALVSELGIATITQLSDIFAVSEMTIHRDLKYLEASGRVEKTHGGVITKQALVETDFERRRMMNIEAKKKIGKAAADLIEDGDSIIIDGSSTCLEIIPNLADRKEITVFTTGVYSCNLLINYSNIDMLCMGGMVPQGTNSFAGPITNENLSKIHADKCFMGAAGVSAQHGITDPILLIAELKKKSAEAANEVIIVADRTKFGRIAKYNSLRLGQFDLIISDAQEDTPCVKEIRKNNVEMLLVK